MRDTTPLEKLIPSVVNVALVLILSIPFYVWFGYSIEWKISAIFIFYIMQVIDTHEHLSFQCFGMRVFGTRWEKKYTQAQRNIYSVLYTLSFSTLLFYVFVPFDLLIFNLLCLQLPTILVSGTTLHGLLAGNMRTKI